MNISVKIQEQDLKFNVMVQGEIDAFTAPKLRERLFPLSEKAGADITIDLSGVTYLDSTGLGVFVGVFKNIRANDGNLQIVGLSQRLMKLFKMTGLANIMNISSRNEGEENESNV
ncbi:STAS domain-containing protein [Bacillus sp. S/N-304-OC-R1]|uniref:STAS domain-containing protein n=1 Tax=Bacillus sp. S/N-304-OC-R1 TaxID=2758034 RepID=UPI001C8D5184|nr:STAS domain-containing protein [Bacillus sp. S/N-304-OC-R1]MBY0121161.1 STAS domain-containing protein [Bacillus sp. S/N-304-OC-R1]